MGRIGSSISTETARVLRYYIFGGGGQIGPRPHWLVPVRSLVTKFEARNLISEPGPQEPYGEIFSKHCV
jgi:hypothetical protein